MCFAAVEYRRPYIQMGDAKQIVDIRFLSRIVIADTLRRYE